MVRARRRPYGSPEVIHRLGGKTPAEFQFWSVSVPQIVTKFDVEFKSGQTIRLLRHQFGSGPPYPIGPDSLFVAYSAAAELGCHLALGWPLPERVLDLYFEFKYLTNGVLPLKHSRSLLSALTFFGLGGIEAIEKQEMIELILRGGPWTQKEQSDILDYCESDVIALRKLLPVMSP